MAFFDYQRSYPSHGSIQHYDYANWGYMTVYFIIIVGSLIGNVLFLMTVKRNVFLHKTPHWFLASLAVRDLLVTFLVIPFVIDSQTFTLMQWRSGEIMCKFYSFIDYGTRAQHSFNGVFLALFLYFWFRKNESYLNQEGQVIVRQTKMHKWAIPLVWVLGLGLAIPAGALAWDFIGITKTRTCSVWHGVDLGQFTRDKSSNYYAALTSSLVGFLVPLVLLVFPFVALTMQLLKFREPKLDPPHNRMALTAVILLVIFVLSRAPAEIFQLIKLAQYSGYGRNAYDTWNPSSRAGTFETDVILNCVLYAVPLIHPLVYFIFNPIYRTGLMVVWKNLYCNKDPQQIEQERQGKLEMRMQQRKYPQKRNRAPMLLRQNDQQLLAPVHNRQSGIIMSSQVPSGHQIVMGGGQPRFGGHQSLEQQQQLLVQQHQQQLLMSQQHRLETSFDRVTPQLPPVFEYDGRKYIDTARVEPRTGYSPEKTPPKTPETPHFKFKPFKNPLDQEIAMKHANAEIESPELSPLIEQDVFKMEDLEASPGSTLRVRKLPGERISPTPIQLNTEFNTNKNSRASSRVVTPDVLKPTGLGYRSRTRPGTPADHVQSIQSIRPLSHLDLASDKRSSSVEINITGRTISRTDLCPEVPRSKFEHSV